MLTKTNLCYKDGAKWRFFLLRSKLKVIISNMAWIEKASFKLESDIPLLRNICTIVPKVSHSHDKIIRPIKMYRETEQYFGVPRHFYRKHSWRQDVTCTYDVSEGIPLRPNSNKIVLREYDQEPVVKTLINSLIAGKWGCGLIEAFVAFGKTVCAIEIINRLGGNALVLVHSTALKDQWISRIKQFYPNARIGEVQGNTCSYKDKDIVIGMIQSIMKDKEKYPKEFYRYFRTLICDEVHKLGAQEFSKAAPKFNTKYSIGVSGTIRRADGCTNVFKWTLGDIVVSADESLRIKPNIYIRETGTSFDPIEKQVFDKRKNLIVTKSYAVQESNRAIQLNHLAKDKERSKKIAADIILSLRVGRNPLVMSERKSILEDVSKYVKAFARVDPVLKVKSISHGFYIGGKDSIELEAASKCDVVYATIQLAKEGIDIQRLETLFLATPLADIEQIVGRVCRPKIDWVDGKPIVVKKKHNAMVLDYVDSDSSLFKALSYKRKSQYSRLGWKIVGYGF